MKIPSPAEDYNSPHEAPWSFSDPRRVEASRNAEHTVGSRPRRYAGSPGQPRRHRHSGDLYDILGCPGRDCHILRSSEVFYGQGG